MHLGRKWVWRGVCGHVGGGGYTLLPCEQTNTCENIAFTLKVKRPQQNKQKALCLFFGISIRILRILDKEEFRKIDMSSSKAPSCRFAFHKKKSAEKKLTNI